MGEAEKSWQLRELSALVCRCLGREITPRTFGRWRRKLGLSKGRGEFYDQEETAALINFGRLVSLNISYDDAHRIIYEQYKGNQTDGT